MNPKKQRLLTETISELVNIALEDTKGYSRRTTEQKQKIASLDGKLDDILNKLPQEERNVLEDYIFEVLTDNDNMYDDVYKQGFKDGVAFLRFTDVI